MDYYDIQQKRKRAGLGKIYTTRRSAQGAFIQRVKTSPGKRKLEIGCGTGQLVEQIATPDLEIVGIDISASAIAKAKTKINAEFYVMDAEQLIFGDNSFDTIYGCGVLHHLNLDKAIHEIARTLKSNGQAIFIEPLGHNPFINLYRRFTPSMRTDDEHPLRLTDIELFNSYFSKVNTHYFCLVTFIGVLFPKVLYFLESIDKYLFEKLPVIRKYAWLVIIELKV